MGIWKWSLRRSMWCFSKIAYRWMRSWCISECLGSGRSPLRVLMVKTFLGSQREAKFSILRTYLLLIDFYILWQAFTLSLRELKECMRYYPFAQMARDAVLISGRLPSLLRGASVLYSSQLRLSLRVRKSCAALMTFFSDWQLVRREGFCFLWERDLISDLMGRTNCWMVRRCFSMLSYITKNYNLIILFKEADNFNSVPDHTIYICYF